MAVILGISTFHAGSSACIVVDGVPLFAIAEERLNRIKYYAGFPKLAIQKALDFAGLKWSDVDHVAVGRNPRSNRAAKAAYALKNPSLLTNFLQMKKKSDRFGSMKDVIAAEFGVQPDSLRFQLHNIEHHLAHNASSYFISPWDKAAGFSLDGSGDFVSAMLAVCEGDQIRIADKTFLPHSVGNFYTMVCDFIGYGKYGDEGKVMGLAPYGENTYAKDFADMVHLTDDGFRLNPKYFARFGSTPGLEVDAEGQMVARRQFSPFMEEKFGKPRDPKGEYEKRDLDLAFGVQNRFEQVYMHMLNLLAKKVKTDKVVLSGGCALNSVANGKLFHETPFAETCIQPAAGDDGLSMGAALYVSNAVLREGKRWVMTNAYMGDEFSDEAVQKELDRLGIAYRKLSRDDLIEQTADLITSGNVLGWFQGRMEWGPRALGNRSILVHPGFPGMKDILNSRIKRREWFRPFAPAVLQDRQTDVFEYHHPSPHMLHVYKTRAEWRERLTAVNHEDNTGRLQTVARAENPLYYDLISAFDRRTGIPVLLNTSFNENEPIVNTPEQAIDCFMRTKMDVLGIGSFLCLKTEQKTSA